MKKLAFCLALVVCGCAASKGGGDAGDPGDAGEISDGGDAGDVVDAGDAGDLADAGDAGDLADAGDAGEPADAGDAGVRWVSVQPDQLFAGIGAAGSELWGVGVDQASGFYDIDHRAADGGWTEASYTQPAEQTLRQFLPLAANDLYALGEDRSTLYHSTGGDWSAAFTSTPFTLEVLAGSGDAVYLATSASATAWGVVRRSIAGGPFRLVVPADECRTYIGGFAGNGVAVFASDVYDCHSERLLSTEMQLSTGGDFQTYPSDYATALWWAASPADIYAGAAPNVVAHLHGGVWTGETLPIELGDSIQSLAGTSANDVWALTGRTVLCHSDGGPWSCEPPVPGVTYGTQLAVTGPGDVWALFGTTLYHREW